MAEVKVHGLTGEEKKKMIRGGIKTTPFIFANEISEKLAVVGFAANMITYLTTELHMPLVKAATTLTNFSAAASLTPLLGAFLADAYIGRFWVIAGASFIYTVGMLILTVSAIVPQLRPQPHEEATAYQLGIFYVSLLLTAIGAGGIRSCVVAFGAEQFEEGVGGSGERKSKTWTFFNWYYFCMGASILLAVTVVVYIQDNVGWGVGLGIPTIAMAISVLSFVAGYKMYRMMNPNKSPFTRLAQVVVAAVRKRNVPVIDGGRDLYENDELDRDISVFGKLLHTDQLKFLDKAAVVTSEESEREGLKHNPWKLSTVHRVEELKSVIRMGPIWAAGILVITAAAQQNTFSLQQARTMDRHITKHSSFQIPPGSMSVFTMLAMLTTITIYDRCLIPLARHFTASPRGISFLYRMGIGFTISILATFVAGIIEVKRRHSATSVNVTTVPISVFWLVPQYSLHGIAEAFTSIGHLEFFYDQSPESLRSMAAALFWMSISMGNYVSSFVVSMVHRLSTGPDQSNWLPNNLNKGRLEYLYWIITVLQVFNLVYYCVCAWFYTYKPVARPTPEDVELA